MRERKVVLTAEADRTFPPSRYLAARRIHPEARTMAVMHRWTIVFHIYGDYVIVDRIIASKMMTE